jgi:formate-dependent nitrite reductase membrane component NrfD
MLDPSSPLWVWAAPLVAGVFLAATGAVLVADLDHPERFYLVLTRPQWRSWLARGGVILSAYGAVLALHLLGSLLGVAVPPRALVWVGVPLAALSAVYTAWLFAQAKARDLWQSPVLPPQLQLQSLLAGSSALVPVAALVQPDAALALARIAAGSTLLHLLLVAGEATMTHGTAHARLAAWEMTSGRYALFFRSGLALQALGAAVLLVGPASVGAALVLAGLLAFEHAFVQAGQSVPLA